MPTQVMFERSVEDVLVADLEANLHASRVSALKAGRLNVELSLHRDLAPIEADWRAFEATPTARRSRRSTGSRPGSVTSVCTRLESPPS
jgi:hypothetical protein